MSNRFLKVFCFFVFISAILPSCTENSLEFEDYVRYLRNPDNGLTKNKVTAGIAIRVMHLPDDYQAFNELKTKKGLLKSEMDSVKKTYASSFAFLMTIGPADEGAADITKLGVDDYKAFNERIMEMSFNMGSMVKLKAGKMELAPEIAQMERTFGLRKSSDLLFVFNSSGVTWDKDENIDFIFNDELFYTGINKFRFSIKDINSIPHLKI